MVYIGKVEVAGQSAMNSAHTSVPFAVPNTAKGLYLVPSATGLLFELPLEDRDTNADDGAPIPVESLARWPTGTDGPVIAIFNPNQLPAVVKVYAALG